MIAQNGNDLAEMLEDPMFVQDIELRDSWTYELGALDLRAGKKVLGAHVHRTNLALYGEMNLHGRFQFRDLTFRIAPGVLGVNAAWGTHTRFDECSFVSLDENNPGVAGLWSDQTADNNNSYGIGVSCCGFFGLEHGIWIQPGAMGIVGGWHVEHSDFSSCTRWGIRAHRVAGLHLDHVLFQDNGRDAYLDGNEIALIHCHSERVRADDKGREVSVIISQESYPVLFCGGHWETEKIWDRSGRAILRDLQESHAMLKMNCNDG